MEVSELASEHGCLDRVRAIAGTENLFGLWRVIRY